MSGGFRSEPMSINDNAATLLELAGYLEAGRPDTELATDARAPRSHHEIGDEVRRFTAFAFDQYRDAVALLAALSTMLRATGGEHVTVDDANRRILDDFITGTTFVPPASR